MEQKDLDRLFQEKLKDIEVTPHPKVWNAIEKKIQKKKRRVIPIWWFYGGTAAMVLLGVFLFFTNKNQPLQNDFPVITNKRNEKKQKLNKESIFEIPTKQTIENKDQQKINLDSKVTEVFKTKKNKEHNNYFLGSKKTLTKNKSNELEKISTDQLKEENFLGIIYSFNKRSSYKNTPFSNNALSLIDTLHADIGEQSISEGITVKGLTSSDIIAKNDSLQSEKTLKRKKIIPKEEEDFFLAEESLKTKWGISPIVGILKSNSFSQVSALDTDLDTNDFSGENSFSYGIHITYKLNKKWSLKSGVQIQKNAFTTNDVPLFSSANAIVSSLENVDIGTVNGNNNSSDIPLIDDGLELNLEENFSEIGEGNLLQNYGYIEIPLEVKYTLFASKNIATSIITGISSLILNENTITSQINNTEETIGEASNLSAINFSGNLGLDIDIKLSEKINFSINPMFKTQLNTFSNNSNGFKPYTIGVYTGLKYKF